MSEKYKETKLLTEMKMIDSSPPDIIDQKVYENVKSNIHLKS